jgi:hypothetical protein
MPSNIVVVLDLRIGTGEQARIFRSKGFVATKLLPGLLIAALLALRRSAD